MAQKRRNINQQEGRKHPDSPDGLVFTAANNKAFAERLIGVFRLAKSGVRKDGRT